MSEYRTVSRSFWNDPYIEGLSKEEKLLFAYLCTCSHIDNLGVLEVSRSRISFETGCTVEEVNAAIGRLEADGKILTADFYILVLNFIRNQTNNSPKVLAGLKGLYAKARNEDIKRALKEKYPHIFKGMEVSNNNNEQEADFNDFLREEG